MPIFNTRLSQSVKLEALLFVFILFFLTSPYFFWEWYGTVLVEAAVTSLALLIVWRQHQPIKGKAHSLFNFFLFVWFVFMFSEFLRGSRTGLVIYLPYFLFGFLPFLKKEFGGTVFNLFVTLYAVMIAISMVSWIAGMTGMIAPLGELGGDNDQLDKQNKYYIVYPLALVRMGDLSELTRFCGFYDEPGVVGTFSALILCARRFNMRDWRNIIVLLSGLLSTSMFFYGLVAVYWLAESIFVRKKYGLFIALLGGIIVFYIATKDNEVLSTLVWERFEWDADRGGFAGNSREGAGTDILINRLTSTGEIWFGVNLSDRKAFWNEFFGLSSMYTVIALYGIVAVGFYLLWLLYIGYHYKISKWDFILYCFVVIGCMYQRTGMFSLPYAFLYVSIARYSDFQLNTGKSLSVSPRREVVA